MPAVPLKGPEPDDAKGIIYDPLHRACIAGAGKSPIDLIHETLIAEAKLRLGQSEQIGFRLGFRDPDHFSRFFKSRVSEPPGAYRREIAALSQMGGAPNLAACA